MNEHEKWLKANATKVDEVHQYRWAMRILTCPKAACRRSRRCHMPGRLIEECPGIIADPITSQEGWEANVSFLRATRRSLEETENPDGPMKGFNAAWDAHTRRRKELSFERAEAELRARKRGAGRGETQR